MKHRLELELEDTLDEALESLEDFSQEERLSEEDIITPRVNTKRGVGDVSRETGGCNGNE